MSSKFFSEYIWLGKLGNGFILGFGVGFNFDCGLDLCEELKKDLGLEFYFRNFDVIVWGFYLGCKMF